MHILRVLLDDLENPDFDSEVIWPCASVLMRVVANQSFCQRMNEQRMLQRDVVDTLTIVCQRSLCLQPSSVDHQVRTTVAYIRYCY